MADLRTTKKRTLPLQDLAVPILFVSARNKSEKEVENHLKPIRPQGSLSGEEIYKFYTSLVTAETQGNEEKKLEKSKSKPGVSVRSRVTSTTKKTESRVLPRKKSSTSEIFTFAQEGKVRELKNALESSDEYDLNFQDMYGWTVLMSAACAGHLDVVDYLLSRGVEWKTLFDKSGRTAVDLARASGHLHVAEWIEAKGTVSGSSDYFRKNASSNQDELQIRSKTSPGPFHCATCGILLRDTARQDHCHSTLHQFNCQHRPIVHRYGIPQSNKGYMLLLGNGWDPEKGLGSVAEGKQFPVKTVLKRDRLGLGAEGRGGERLKARITHFGPGDTSAVERPQRRRLKHESSDGNNLPKKKKRAVEIAKERKWEMELRRHLNSE